MARHVAETSQNLERYKYIVFVTMLQYQTAAKFQNTVQEVLITMPTVPDSFYHIITLSYCDSYSFA